MASYFNLGTDQSPRWVNLENFAEIKTKMVQQPGKSEIYLGAASANGEVVRGEAADRLIAQLSAHPELKKTAGIAL